jgi:hypothetical protein
LRGFPGLGMCKLLRFDVYACDGGDQSSASCGRQGVTLAGPFDPSSSGISDSSLQEHCERQRIYAAVDLPRQLACVWYRLERRHFRRNADR